MYFASNFEQKKCDVPILLIFFAYVSDDSREKNCRKKKISSKFLQICSFVTEIENKRENVCSILYDINLFKKYDQHRKNYQQNRLSL